MSEWLPLCGYVLCNHEVIWAASQKPHLCLPSGHCGPSTICLPQKNRSKDDAQCYHILGCHYKAQGLIQIQKMSYEAQGLIQINLKLNHESLTHTGPVCLQKWGFLWLVFSWAWPSTLHKIPKILTFLQSLLNSYKSPSIINMYVAANQLSQLCYNDYKPISQLKPLWRLQLSKKVTMQCSLPCLIYALRWYLDGTDWGYPSFRFTGHLP